MRIGYFESRDEDVRILRPLLRDHELRLFPGHLSAETPDDRIADLEAISVSIGAVLGRRLLSRLPALRCVATRSTRADHLDLQALDERRIAVLNVPDYGENTVAEHTFALILALSRKVAAAFLRTRARRFDVEGLEGMDLRGRTLGVVGCGRIGARVAELGRAFDMSVEVHDLAPAPSLAARLGFTYQPFHAVLAHADILSLHVPLTPDTHHLIDERALAMVRPGVILINTSRGEVVDTGALLRALDRGVVAACGLDVLEGERAILEEAELLEGARLRPDDARVLLEAWGLIDRPNVVVTPHIGFFSHDAIERIVRTTADNLLGFASGNPPNRIA
jgi:D-lactate dehydrogenase